MAHIFKRISDNLKKPNLLYPLSPSKPLFLYPALAGLANRPPSPTITPGSVTNPVR